MSKIAIFRHCTMMGHYEPIEQEITKALEESNLLYNADFYQYNRTVDASLYEFPTLESLREFCINNPDYFVLYLHSKGVSHEPDKKCIADWRACMLYFNVYQWTNCTRYLRQGFDAAGVCFIKHPMPHFQGNFWWANSNYIATLPPVKETPLLPNENNWNERHKAEMWLLNSKKYKHHELYNYNCNPYKDEHPKEKYIKK